MGLVVTGAIGFAALALTSTTCGRFGDRRALLIGIIVAGVLVGGLFNLAFPVFSRDSPRTLGTVFAGGLLGALPFLVYFGLGYAFRPRGGGPGGSGTALLGVWLVSLAIFLPYCFFVGLESIGYLRCPAGSNFGACFFN
jgi:hypothetical protein